MQTRHRRSGRRPLAVAVLSVAGTFAVASGAGAITSARSTPGTPAAGTVVRGTLERVAVEGSGLVEHAHRPGPARRQALAHRQGPAVLSFVRTGSSRVQVRAADVAGVPTGSLVEAVLGPARATTSTTAGATARRVRVVRRGAAPRPAAPPRPADPTHQVTVALVVPPGGSPDATTPAGVAALVSGGVSTFWSQASAGRVSFSVAATHDWMPTTASCREPFALWAEVKRRTGFVDGPGRHLLVYVTSRGTDSCYYGLGTVGTGTTSGGDVYVRDVTTSILAHELGHNLGLGHSDELQCSGVTDGSWADGWSPGCRQAGYRDWYDVMGISWEHLGSLSTAHAYALGLLPPAAVETVSTPVAAELAPVAGTTGLRSLRVVDPGGPTYVVEYRAATGRDAYLAGNWPGLRPGVVVRRADPADGTQTLLLDATPSGQDDWDADFDVPLVAGSTVTTASGRVTLRVDALTPSGALLSVGIDGVWPVGGAGRRVGRTPSGGVDPTPSATATSDPGGRVGRRSNVRSTGRTPTAAPTAPTQHRRG